MKLYQIQVPKDDAQNVLNEFGDIGIAQFIDLNKEESPYNLPYTKQIKECEDTERKLNYLLSESKKNLVDINPPENIDGFLRQLKIISDTKRKALNLLFEEIQKDISKQESFIQQQNTQMNEAQYSVANISDCLQVFKVARDMIPNLQNRYSYSGDINDSSDIQDDEVMGLINNENNENNSSSSLNKIAGVVEKPEIERLRRLIFRATKGKSFMYVQDYESDKDINRTIKRSVYIIMYWEGQHLKNKIEKISSSFAGQRYNLPKMGQIQKMIDELQQALEDSRLVLKQTRKSLRDQLQQFDIIDGQDDAQDNDTKISTIYIYKMFLAKEKALYQLLNMMKWQNQTFIGYFWAPIENQAELTQKLAQFEAVRITQFENHNISRPTYVKTNKFTAVMQTIVDTYGTPRYQEANPAYLTIVTFPFFFGMMFGDMGHGSLLFAAASYMIFNAENLKNSMFSILLPARYLFLLMGFGSFYAGFIYNEFFAMSTNFFGSCYNMNKWENIDMVTVSQNGEGKQVSEMVEIGTFRRISNECVYPFGLDPAWSVTENELNFINSIKMKMAVVFGVLHMSFGIFVKGTNTIYFRRIGEFFTEVIGALIILWGLFGWMDALIITKFFRTYDIDNCAPKTYNAEQIKMLENEQELEDAKTCQGDIDNRKTPSIINIMITTVFGFGQYDTANPQDPIIGDSEEQMYQIALTLLVLVIIFVPIMLFTKPCAVLFSNKNDDEEDQKIELTDMRNSVNDQDNESQLEMEGGAMEGQSAEELVAKRKSDFKKLEQQLKEMEPDNHGNTFGDVFIHQMIETIEFVLGTVSNTASYLRLWALSLAHTELAGTFLKLTFGPIVLGSDATGTTIILGLILWPVLWSITVGVLMCMDLMECFLHTLRLHWVEFQNKFYKGDGYQFKPYSFTIILQSVLDH